MGRVLGRAQVWRQSRQLRFRTQEGLGRATEAEGHMRVTGTCRGVQDCSREDVIWTRCRDCCSRGTENLRGVSEDTAVRWG